MTRWIVLVFIVSSHTVLAQRPLTLAAAQQEARAQAPEVAQLDALVRSAEAVATQAGRRFRQNPGVTGTFGTGVVGSQSDERSWSVGAALPVDFSGSWHARAALAAADVTHAEQQREDGLRALDESVADAVADLAYQQRFAARAGQVVQLQRLAATEAHHQLNVGDGSELSADSADLDLAALQVVADQAAGDLAAARVRLARLLGRRTPDDLVVADPEERPPSGSGPDFEPLVERDPRVQVAAAELVAARSEQRLYQQLVAPTPTLGIEFGDQRRDIPPGSFAGAPDSSTWAARWSDRELTFTLNVPVPLFDRQQQSRAQATGRLLTAEAALATTRADVRQELMSAWAALQAASRVLERVDRIQTTITRDITFVQQAVTAGAFSDVQRTQQLRRLLDTGRLVDTAVRDFRIARAAWIRRAGP